MSPLLRLVAGVVTLTVGIGIAMVPDDGIHPKDVGTYLFIAFMFLCTFVCAVPWKLGYRLVVGGASLLSFTLLGFTVRMIVRDHSLVVTLHAIEVLFVTPLIGAGTAFYTFTGRLPRWLWLIAHRLPPDERQG